MSAGQNLKTGTVEVKCTSTVTMFRNKKREMVVHPTMLSYYKKKRNRPDQLQHVINRPLDFKRDFLLAPLGFTEIVQVGEDLLLIVSKRKKVKNEQTGEIISMKEPVVFQQLTLKFNSREERDEWMESIIAECDKVYLETLIDNTLFFAGRFVEAAHNEIWAAILLGDEPLRKAYIASAGSDQITYVRLILEEVIVWIKMLLGIQKLVPVHKKIFVALLSLMLEDPAARALLMLLRPKAGDRLPPVPGELSGEHSFLMDYKRDTGAGVYSGLTVTDPLQIEVLEKCAAALSFVQYVKKRLQSPSWKQYRSFLAIIDHPAMPPRADATTAYVEKETAPGEELAWATRSKSMTAEFTWAMIKTALNDTPYLSYYFINKEIQDVIDDERVRRVLILIDRVPSDQLIRVFAADGVAKRVRQHFRALTEYCKYRETWKVFGADHARNNVFFESVHMHIWSRITMTEDPWLRGLFLPTTVTSSTSSVAFADVLAVEMVANSDPRFLQSLKITVDTDNAPEDVLRARVSNSHHQGTVFFRRLMVHRLALWVQRIVGRKELGPADAPVFVSLLIAAARSAVIRAVMWLIAPTAEAFQEGMSITPGSVPLVEQFIASLLNLVKPRNRLERFLSFLAVAEHPLAGKVYAPHVIGTLISASALNGPAVITADTYAISLTWAEEMAWMDTYPHQTWSLSWGEFLLMLNDTPYFSLQILMRRLHQETAKSLRWLKLLRSMPNDIVVARFLADVNMCAVNGTHQFGSHAVKMGAHFLTFIDSRRVAELWKMFQTNFLNSNTPFVEEAQNRLLIVLEHQRESPGNSATNRSGFCKMMVLLDTATPLEMVRTKVLFKTVIPISVWTTAALGDATWTILLSLFRPQGEAGGTAPVSAVSPLRSEHLVTFKKFLEHIAHWCAAFFDVDAPEGSIGAAFSEVLSSCLDNPVLRALLVIVKPRRPSANTLNPAPRDAQHAEAAHQRLTAMLTALNDHKEDRYFLYLLFQLGHKGTKQEPETLNVTLEETAWEVESDWLWTTQRNVTIGFDPADFELLDDPAYLLFRYVSRNFRIVGDEQIHSTVNQVQKMLPDAVDRAFKAHDNYLPCRNQRDFESTEPVESAHFKHLLTYALFNEMWKIIMSRLTNPSLDLGFAQSVMYATWLQVNSNANPELSRLLLPLESDLHWHKLTYLVAVQRHAIITIARSNTFSLSRLYRTIIIPRELTASPEDISAHHVLVDRITKWVHSLLGGRQHHLEENDAGLFMEIFAAAATDVAMRAFLVTFVPAPSLVTEFIRSAKYAQLPLSVHEVDEATALRSAAIKFIKLLAQTFRNDMWQQFRSFLDVLHHPLRDSNRGNAWSDETEWIHERLQIRSAMVSWQEVEYVMTETPYIFLLLVTKALPTVEQQKAAMMNIPSKYLVNRFTADSSDITANSVNAPHFIAMCLHEATSDCALEVFQERKMISDGFFEALLSEAVMDSACPRLLQAFRLLQKFLYAATPTPYYHGGNMWNIEMLHEISSISSVLITFLWDISQRLHFRRDEKIIGNLILLIFQLESCSSDGSVANATAIASEWMRRDVKFADMVRSLFRILCPSHSLTQFIVANNAFVETFFTQLFEMVEALNFPKWFSRLCWNFNVHFGKIVEVVPEPVLAMDAVYTEPTEPTAAPARPAADDHNGDVMLDPTIPLTKHKLTMSILGFFNLCLEFKPQVLCDFVAGLGTGRPFFSFFLHSKETLGEQVLLSLTNILSIKPGTLLYDRVQQRYLFYDNDHLTPAAVKTLGLRTSKVASACLNLTDSEFTDLLTVAMYTHDMRDMKVRFENAVISMIADQERREMVVKFMQWMLEYFITPDITRESNPLNTKANERCKWKHCEKFNNTTFEDIIECAAEATISSHLLRGAARSNSYNTLERLFQNYICKHEPSLWKDLFRGSKTIAYFIKYVDVEDLTLAFTKFYEMNPGNHCFMHHLLKVRRALTQPIVSAQDLISLTASSTSFDDDNAGRFFEQLRLKAKALPKEQGDLKMVYLLTASWMKISKEKVLFPLPPRNAQIITLLTVASWAKSLLGPKKDMRMGKALIAQVGTGEGKSLIIAMMAIYFVVVLKKRVHILENNPGLLDKDVETMKPLFAEFGILTQHEGVGADLKPRLSWTSTEKQGTKDCRSEFAKVGVTYCLRRNLELFYQDSIMAEDFHPLANTVLIVDEVDDLIVDEKPNQPYAAKDSDQADFQAACREAQVESDRAAQDGGELNIADFANGDFVRETAANAYLMAKEMVLDQHYAVVGGKYVILQDGKPVEVYDYTLECLKFIKHGIPPTFSSTYYVQSVPYLLSQYDCITGFSGSLGSPSERAFLAQQYKAWSFNTPSFLNTCTNVYKVPPELMKDALYPEIPCVHVYDTVDQQMDKIVDMCLQLHLKVPVLVIAKSPEEALVIEEQVKAALAAQALINPPATGSMNKYVQLFRQYKLGTMTLDKANWGHIVRRATSQGPEDERFCITITDPFGGRGHDFDVHDDEVNRLGGLAVIMTSIPASEREWRQWKGRTARKDNRGQYAVVLCAESSPVSTAKEILVDYALRRANHDAIPNLYKEDLIDKLLSVQDANQLAKLRVLEAEILIGRRLNRLCDMFYETFGAMSVGTWPKSDEEVKLRYLLTDSSIIGPAVTKAFTDFDLSEHDANAPNFEPPDMKNPAFWGPASVAEWIEKNAEHGEAEEAAPTPTQAAPAHAPLVHTWSNNPLNANPEPAAQQAQSAAPAPSPGVKDKISMFNKNNKSSPLAVENTRAQRRQSSAKNLNNISPLGKQASTPKSKPASARVNTTPGQGKGPTIVENLMNAAASFFDRAHPDDFTDDSSGGEGCHSEEETHPLTTHDIDIHLPNAISDMAIDVYDDTYDEPPTDFEYHPPPPPVVEIAPPQDLAGELDGIAIVDESAALPPPPQAVNPMRRATAAKVVVQAKPRPVAPVVDESTANGKVATTQLQTQAEIVRTAANTAGFADQSSGIVAANNSGYTETSGIKAMNLARGAAHAREMRVLDVLCVGDTSRLSNQLDITLKEKLFAVSSGGDPLTVAVYDITGPNTGKGVAGLEVSGAITVTKQTYTMVFEVKVTPEDYQYNMLLYGKKRLEAKWKDVTLLSTQVLFKPAPKLRPRGAFAFHDATNDKKIPAGGHVLISSHDDPRSTAERPLFPPVKVPYTGGNIQLPPNLPDCIISVTPDITGYSNEYSEKFILYNNETIAEDVLKMMLSASDLSGGEWRVVLTWGAHPQDLDFYCITNFNPRRIYFGAKNEGGSKNATKGNIELDIDVRNGFGPETITFTPDATKRYRFLVHNYTGNSSMSIAGSGAKLVVNKGGRPAQFEVPTDIVLDDSGGFALFWHVFDLVNGAIDPVNRVIKEDLRNVALPS